MDDSDRKFDDIEKFRKIDKSRVMKAELRSVSIRKREEDKAAELRREILKKFGPVDKELQLKYRLSRWVSRL